VTVASVFANGGAQLPKLLDCISATIEFGIRSEQGAAKRIGVGDEFAECVVQL